MGWKAWPIVTWSRAHFICIGWEEPFECVSNDIKYVEQKDYDIAKLPMKFDSIALTGVNLALS